MTAHAKVELCVAEVVAWLTNNNLKVNMDTSEAIIFSSAKKRVSLSDDLYIIATGHQIQPSSCLGSLGVIFVCSLRMEYQMAKIVKVCFTRYKNVG